MPRIRCHYIDCVFLDDGYCGAAAVEIDPDTGCMTFSRADELDSEDKWDKEEEELEDAAELTEICIQDTGIGYVPSCITSEKA